MRNIFKQTSKAQFDSLYKNQQFIGAGVTGQVFGAYLNQKPVAIKYFRKQYLQPQTMTQVESMIELLKQFKHQNILNFIDTHVIVLNSYIKKYCLVTQFCQQSLEYYQILKQLSVLQKLHICRQLVSGLAFIHKKNIMHRNIKPSNIFIKSLNQMSVKIGDFGCSKISSQNLLHTSYIGTPLYCDPNVGKGQYTFKCDIYSVGLLIVYIFFGEHYFSHCRFKSQLIQAQQKFFCDIAGESRKFLQKILDASEELKQFLIEVSTFTLCKDQNTRINSSSLLQLIQNEIQSYNLTQIDPTITFDSGQSKINMSEFIVSIESQKLKKICKFQSDQ